MLVIRDLLAWEIPQGPKYLSIPGTLIILDNPSFPRQFHIAVSRLLQWSQSPKKYLGRLAFPGLRDSGTKDLRATAASIIPQLLLQPSMARQKSMWQFLVWLSVFGILNYPGQLGFPSL